jgi:hypothetical protein
VEFARHVALAAAEATRKLDALNSDARLTVLTSVVIPAQKKLYEKVTGKPFTPAVPTKEGKAAPVVKGGNVMTDAALVEPVIIPGYAAPEFSDTEREKQDAARRKQFEDEARYSGITEQDRASFFKMRDEQIRTWQRAAELRGPAPAGHSLREFGQSDRETVENANHEASVPQALAMMNGQLVPQIPNRFSQIMLTVGKAATPEEKVDAVYFTLFSRKPTPQEKSLWNEAQRSGLTTDDLIFSLLNTQQFIFVQ